jgi:hypothetical protein
LGGTGGKTSSNKRHSKSLTPSNRPAILLSSIQIEQYSIKIILVGYIHRRTTEEKEGKQPSSSDTRSSQRPKPIKKGLEERGAAKRIQAELQWMREGQRVRPGLKRLRPEDLPPGVKAARGYDHRGHCLIFEHNTLGALGKIVLINIREGKMLLQAEICKAPDDMPAPLVQKKKRVFEHIVPTVNNRFDENFPE